MTGPPSAPELAITFLYYRDLPRALDFYTRVLGFSLVIDQGWSKSLRIADGAHVGLVDQSREMKRASVDKPVQLCIRVADVDGWHAHAKGHAAEHLSEVFENNALGIRAFVFDDPEGYQIEVQATTRSGA